MVFSNSTHNHPTNCMSTFLQYMISKSILAIERPIGSKPKLHKIAAQLESGLAAKLPNHPSIPKALAQLDGKCLFGSRSKNGIAASEFWKLGHSDKLAIIVDFLTAVHLLYTSGLGLQKIELGFAISSASDRQYELSDDTCICIWPTQILWVMDDQMNNIVTSDRAISDWRCTYEGLRLLGKLTGLDVHEELATCIETKSILDVIQYFKVRHAGSGTGHSSSISIPLAVGRDV